MLYQKMLMQPNPYFISVNKQGTTFQVHRHPELEFNYCISGGGYSISLKGKTYDIKPKTLTLITPMAKHGYSRKGDSDAFNVTVTLGSVFLGEYYKPFSKVALANPVIDISSDDFKGLREIFEDIARLKNENNYFSDLTQRGDLYKICAYILKYFILTSAEEADPDALLSVSKIEKALEYMESNYHEKLTISDVSALCGYKESNFCKHFKRITGMTFHSALNKRRIENACYLLKNSTLPLDDVAVKIGFEDAKTLCRVFRKELGCTPTEYRKSN